MDREIQTRLRWVNLYGDVGNAGMVCQRCGILRPTLRKWIKRYEQFGLEGLKEKSRRPKTSPKRKMADEKADWS
jgi:transposase-like protein